MVLADDEQERVGRHLYTLSLQDNALKMRMTRNSRRTGSFADSVMGDEASGTQSEYMLFFDQMRKLHGDVKPLPPHMAYPRDLHLRDDQLAAVRDTRLLV
jgi:hypothetical protein